MENNQPTITYDQTFIDLAPVSVPPGALKVSDPFPSPDAGSVVPSMAGTPRGPWREARVRMEVAKEKHSPRGGREIRHWDIFKFSTGLFRIGLQLTGLYAKGVRNARNIGLNRLELVFDDLPREFDGFRILQLSDLHFDALPETTESTLRLVYGLAVDLCVLTGDYRCDVAGPFAQILPTMEELVSRLSSRHGIYAVLGNHDCAGMVEPFEARGISMLINETIELRRNGARIHLTGTDDAHYYYTDEASSALRRTPDGFKIALVHSAELAHVAADSGFRLYLTGHTHGGQVCLPGGRPIITHMTCNRGYASGLWRHGNMTGYTSTGVGVSALPVRYGTRGEVALITLRRAAQAPGSNRLHR